MIVALVGTDARTGEVFIGSGRFDPADLFVTRHRVDDHIMLRDRSRNPDEDVVAWRTEPDEYGNPPQWNFCDDPLETHWLDSARLVPVLSAGGLDTRAYGPVTP